MAVEETGTGATSVKREERKQKPSCMVLFRPHDDYKGEFGFDWLRTKDSGLASEPDYETIIEAAYKNGTDDHLGADAFTVLEREYKQLLMWGFAPQGGRGFGKYYVPYLNLFSKSYSKSVTANITPKPPYEAKLKVLVEIKNTDILEIKLEYNSDIFLIDGKKEFSLQDTAVCPLKESQTISITCLKDFSSNAEILAYAYYEDRDGEIAKQLAGKIIVGANDARNRKEVKFVFVCVKTNVTGRAVDKKIGSLSEVEQTQLRQTLYQALIRPLIWVKTKNNNNIYENIVLDLTTDRNFKTGGKYIDNSGLLNEDADGGSMFAYLRNKFMNNPTNAQYKGCFPVFSIEAANYDNALGQVEGIGVKNLVLFTGRDFQTIAHEAFHGFGLWHTHRERREAFIRNPDKKYVYPHGHYNSANATDNVMSYRENHMITTWQWKWKIARKNVK